MADTRSLASDAAPSRREHWEGIYASRSEEELSWFQARPAVSLRLVASAGVGPDARIVDVGGGASRLVDALLDAGFRRVAVLDVADGALEKSRRRLGPRAAAVEWIACDVTAWRPGAPFDLWHDRAVFHFLTRPEDRQAYRAALGAALRPGGQVVIGTFSSAGPEKCSGLPVVRWEPETLAAELGPGFRLVESARDEHVTPAGKVQRFQFSRFVRA
ncbi:MAG TPA: class I SAM-dependent methyltransferase [Anaeromyxobacter sp.]|nr:class I SAM-dependent methyltransferase [Anaeromyxobacter sp.]